MKDSLTYKIAGFWLAIVSFFSLLSLLPEEKRVEPTWVPRSQITQSEKNRMNPPKGPGITLRKGDNSYDWEGDKKNETNRWLDFIEDCDNLGITPYDPDAVELWSEKY